MWGQPRGLMPQDPLGLNSVGPGLIPNSGIASSPLAPALVAAQPAPVAPPIAAAVQASSGRNRFGARDIIGILADAILAGTGRPAVYGPAVARRSQALEEAQREERDYTRRRADTQADWLARQEWERNNRPPPAPTELQRNADYYRSIGRPDLAEAFLVNRATPMVAMDRIDEAGNTVREYIRPGAAGAPAAPAPNAPPPPAVGTVRHGYRFNGGNPADPNAWTPVNQGGPTRTGSATFP